MPDEHPSRSAVVLKTAGPSLQHPFKVVGVRYIEREKMPGAKNTLCDILHTNETVYRIVH